MRDKVDWKEILRPGDWVVLNNNQEAVIIGRRDDAYWVELVDMDGEQRYVMVSTGFIKSVSKNLEHWLLAV